ncbi:MAG TPA: DNA methyltransferase [Acidimicrobiales bacterium]|nr:DNA methyltransferase [Acidimicrobiales bacterium]
MPAEQARNRVAGTDEVEESVLEVDDELAGGEGMQPRLTEPQIEEIATLLRGGRRLPPHLFPNLYEAPREYQLSYRGKSRAVDILAETMAVPLQPARSFGESVNAWTNMLVLGDNLQVLRELLHLKEHGQLRNADGSDGVRLCYIDPPFASQREFVGSRSERAYQDRVAGAEFVENLRRRLILIRELLADNGSLFVHLDTRKSHYIKVVLDELFGEGNFRNEIVWKRTSGHSDAALLGSVHETILYYTKGSSPVWNPEFVPYEEWYVEQYYRYRDPDGRKFMSGDLGAAGLAGGGYDYEWKGVRRVWRVPETTMARLDEEGKIFYTRNGIPRIKRYLDESKGQPLADVWTDVLPVVSWSQERIGYPTQKPVQLIARIIEVASEPNDIVLDAFVGSGTTLVACEQFDEPRRWIGIDSGKFAIYASQARLLEQAGKQVPDRGFTLYNAGLYDYKALRELPRSDFVDFVLELFQCRKATTDIGGVTFDGYMGDNPVLVYDFEKHPEATIGEAFVEDLANICRGRLGDRCFIIAPASTVEPYEDYLTVGDTRFFFLRIPYSVIAELHKKAFSDLRQPTSEAMTNALIDSIGFDFIQPPRVECEYLASDDSYSIKITGFESEAFAARPTSENIADLAMVLVDLSYDNEVFCLDSVFFADDLKRDGWRISFPRESVSDRMMVVYIDLFGNEYREVKHLAEFVAAGPLQTPKRGSAATRSLRATAAARSPRKATKKASTTKKAPPAEEIARATKALKKAVKSTVQKSTPTRTARTTSPKVVKKSTANAKKARSR